MTMADSDICQTCGEHHPTTESCLRAWLNGLRSNKAPAEIVDPEAN